MARRLLHVAVSPRGKASLSRLVAGELIVALRDGAPDVVVIERDLAAAPIPHPNEVFVAASLTSDAEHGAAERDALALSETLIAELESANVIVLSTLMHNFAAASAKRRALRPISSVPTCAMSSVQSVFRLWKCCLSRTSTAGLGTWRVA